MAGEIEHDLDRWGALFTDEQPRRELVRLADVVRSVLRPFCPLRRAVFAVLNGLLGSGGTDVFLLCRATFAEALTNDHRWMRPPERIAPDSLDGVDRYGKTSPFEWLVHPAPDELLESFDHPGWKQECIGGRAGLFQCLFDCWLMQAKSEAQLDRDLAGRIAISRADAERLFPAGGYPLRSVQPVVPDAPATEADAGMKLDGASLFRRQTELIAAKHKAPTQQLVQETGLHEKEIQRRMKAHRPTSAPHPCLDYVWGGSSKVHKAK